VGNGVVNAYQILNRMKQGIDDGGFGQADFNVYNDIKSASAWGVNHFGVFAPGLSAFVGFNKNVGAYAGAKGGGE
jgi:hypothetical protein